LIEFRYLFDNRNLATMIVNHWEYDPSSLGMFDYFRISANASYPFMYSGKVHILRFCPISEREMDQIRAEILFCQYLRSQGYSSVDFVTSKRGEYLERIETPWGAYYASVTKQVSGKKLDDLELTDTICWKLGKALGELHSLSKTYTGSNYRRWNHDDVLTWIRNELKKLPQEEKAIKEVDILRDEMARIAINEESYGLIHFDFETDNVFFDADKDKINVIDFDDSMFNWYRLDIEQTLDSINEKAHGYEYAAFRKALIEGYKSVVPFDDIELANFPVFRRFINLFGYTRIKRAMRETWDYEPQWMMDMRTSLAGLSAKKAYSFTR
jgi:Ser/Thr protein kinase RdoA (MazF antagonist)